MHSLSKKRSISTIIVSNTNDVILMDVALTPRNMAKY